MCAHMCACVGTLMLWYMDRSHDILLTFSKMYIASILFHLT